MASPALPWRVPLSSPMACKRGGRASSALTVSMKEHEEEVVEQQAEKSGTEEVNSDATAQAMMQVPLALLGAAFTMPGAQRLR